MTYINKLCFVSRAFTIKIIYRVAQRNHQIDRELSSDFFLWRCVLTCLFLIFTKMSTYRPAQIFATVNSAPHTKQIKKQEFVDDGTTLPTNENEIQVTATGEVTFPPDRCRVTISVNSVKDQAQEAKNSVARRVDYILQTLANHQIRVKNYL